MTTLTELRRLAEEAADECGHESDWFDGDLIESGEPICSSRKARRFIAAASPATVLKLLEVVKAARLSLHYHMGLAAITRSELNRFDAALSSALDALSPLPSEGKLRKEMEE